ncbi:BnaCnng23760D [Brassica napus]|uniref:BnaCnng23760D protein n=1 Tax=Brassica napus TaxID=3708 RepID=A0A078ISE1_BRANA|nr:BnaCnng23760D [Brassica napus]
MAKSRRVGWGRHKCVPFNVCSCVFSLFFASEAER